MARKTIVGLFNDTDAQAVVRDLEQAGFDRSEISIIRKDDRSTGTTTTGTSGARDEGGDVSTGAGAAIGAGTGAAIGGGLGFLAGAAGFFIPGIGPLLGVGPMAATIIGGAGIGAAAGGIAGALVNSGVPEDEAQRYTAGVHRGHTLITLAAADARADDAVAIFNRHDPIDIHSEDFGTDTSDATAQTRAMPTPQPRQTGTARPTTQTVRSGENEKLDVVEEQIQVGKRTERTGGVRVYKTVEERPVEEQVTLREEHVNIERRPTDRPATAADLNAFQEGTIEVTEHAERPVVQKEARVVEEVVVSKDVDQRTETVRDTVRRTDVHVEQMGNNPGQDAGDRSRSDFAATGTTTGSTSMRAFDDYDTECRTNFQKTYPDSGYTYDQVRPAYRYGYDLASNSDGDWNTVENDARTRWEARNPGTWEKFKDATRYAFDRARNKVTGNA